jgi:DNA-binding transcriptional MerR regulator/methylmalonyl-CoA mutase cobalamin-binding subunit
MTENSAAPDVLPEEGMFPIRTVSAATGVNAVTLRAWERRYSLLTPKRTPKGHRLYSREQIDTIRRVVELLDQGVAISQVKPLLNRRGETGEDVRSGDGAPPQDTWQAHRERLLEGIAAYDIARLDRLYSDVLSLYPVDTVTQRLTVPVLETLGARWRTGSSGVAEEHFFNGYLRNKLGARFHHLSERSAGPRLVAACVPGEQHETGLLLFSLSAAAHGYRLVYLGANMPFEELPHVVSRSDARAVVLSATSRHKRAVLAQMLPDLVQALDVPVFFGGHAALTHRAQIAASGALPVGVDIPQAVRTINKTLAG